MSDAAWRFVTLARKNVVAQVIARLVAEIDYAEFIRSVHFDFGADPQFLIWTQPNGLQVARLKPY